MPITSPDLTGLSILAAFAHPDDEGFGCGGTLAMLGDLGAKITLVCATNGDVGEISDPALATPDNLYIVRQQELRDAMSVTGIQDIRFLDYRDSGMDGTDDNKHPNSLSQTDAKQVVDRLMAIMEQVRPNAVITHDPSGGYGHPDHKSVYQHMTAAFYRSIEVGTSASPEQGQQHGNPQELYYVCFPRSNFRRMWQEMLDLGITPPFASMDIDSLGSSDDEVTTTLDVSGYVDTKISSLDCHRTQLDPNGPFAQFPKEKMRAIMSTEYFTLANPEAGKVGKDLLARLAK